MGHVFVLNRETGDHLFPVEERAVPVSDVPGEEASKTQPFPLQLPLLGLRKVTPEDAWGPTPELMQKAKERISKHINQGHIYPARFTGLNHYSK